MDASKSKILHKITKVDGKQTNPVIKFLGTITFKFLPLTGTKQPWKRCLSDSPKIQSDIIFESPKFSKVETRIDWNHVMKCNEITKTTI